jgi:hypothetical protein
MSQPDSQDELLAALPLGVPTPGRGRTITAGEITALAEVSEWPAQARAVEEAEGEPEPLELEPHLVLPLALSLAAANPLFHRLEQDQGLVIVAALSHRAVLSRPVRANDTIITETEIQSVRASSSKPGHYIMTLKDVGMDQHRNEIVVIERVLLMRHEPVTRPAGEERSLCPPGRGRLATRSSWGSARATRSASRLPDSRAKAHCTCTRRPLWPPYATPGSARTTSTASTRTSPTSTTTCGTRWRSPSISVSPPPRR